MSFRTLSYHRTSRNAKCFKCSLEYLFVAGEHCDHETRLWAQEHFGVSEQFQVWAKFSQNLLLTFKKELHVRGVFFSMAELLI